MLKKSPVSRLENLWDDSEAVGMSEPEKLLYRSNLLGSDKRVTNYGGGNTSAKVVERDPLTGDEVEVLWVKGSGGDIGTIRMDGFATLYMDKLEALKGLYRGPEHEDEMVGYLPHCTFNLNTRAASIDTPLHAFVPRRHVDHVHPDAIIAIAASANSKELTQEIFGDEIGWLPWKRPGYELGLWLEKFCRKNPEAKGVVLESHGLFTWADEAKVCYETTLRIINRAIAWFEEKTADTAAFGGEKHPSLPPEERRRIAAALMPAIRGMISEDQHKVGHFDDQNAVLEFVGSHQMEALAALGTSCPDHFLRTKIRPLVVDFDPASPDIADTLDRLRGMVESYRVDYAAYYDRCRHDDSPAMRDPNAVVYLVPGVGMITFAKDKPTARISGEFYVNAINVMRGASAVSEYRGLPEQEAFDIEYWLLEEAKLQRMPAPKSLAGRVAIVTGGAGGIGSATAERYLREGACVVLADIDAEALSATRENLAGRFGPDVVRAVEVNVTSEEAVAAAYADMAVEFGGVDIVVSNAGIASSAPVEDTTLELWNRNMSILSTGYFLVAREAFRMLKAQGIGGSMVFVASKNGLAASPGASAYCTAKASEIHLARCLALEGAPEGIRVNVVNPDAVLRGSRIWQGDWLDQRASTYGTDKEGLEEMYRQRSLLKRSVLPEDIAEACYFFAADTSAKSTGNIINVDAGNVQAFTR
ncbi:bifunctional rhamnulose-1-phosphate aldolase/short-chain dehydrogenase [Tranquillimonas alkanivorans]|uniref:Rhamnulose-1-phosphate aldolase/alcohol dehydrogenase n=1 Tax=Tranquillimonas alkanivorans TaxID=441119 RepID=A0A1I5Q885_9RHOB|nr:bifunctional rhamnulose-1-phosphate aldolase/short-chain dehydrogenase [Tranquillimonas alkanivorans]SFP42086.1 rhamnulose-1-phosphate aldolase/alcohol dehydrogenase [Tranquillimonas alkanivorans]